MKLKAKTIQPIYKRVYNAPKLIVKDLLFPPKRVPYGCIMYTGEVGSGKTLSAIDRLESTKKLYNVPVHIFTNIGYVNQDGEIKSIQDILDAPSNSIFLIDEAPTLFNSRNWKDFPIEMFTQLVQNRKHAKQFLLTAQFYDHADKNFRDLTNWVVECYGIRDRLFYQYWYKPRDYKKVQDSVDEEFVAKKIRQRLWFVGTDDLRSKYDTLEVVKALQTANQQQAVELDLSVGSLKYVPN